MKHEKEHKEYIALLTFRMPTDHHWSTLPLQKQTTGVQSNRVKFHKNSKVVVIILKGNNEEQNSFYRIVSWFQNMKHTPPQDFQIQGWLYLSRSHITHHPH